MLSTITRNRFQIYFSNRTTFFYGINKIEKLVYWYTITRIESKVKIILKRECFNIFPKKRQQLLHSVWAKTKNVHYLSQTYNIYFNKEYSPLHNDNWCMTSNFVLYCTLWRALHFLKFRFSKSNKMNEVNDKRLIYLTVVYNNNSNNNYIYTSIAITTNTTNNRAVVMQSSVN